MASRQGLEAGSSAAAGATTGASISIPTAVQQVDDCSKPLNPKIIGVTDSELLQTVVPVAACCTRPASVTLLASRQRPNAASNLRRPAPLVGTVDKSKIQSTGKNTSGTTCQMGYHRPASAGSGAFSTSNAAITRLKAELAQLAAIGNVQLQSLRPTRASKTAGCVDASAALEAQVLLQLTQLTYSEARAAAVDVHHEHAHVEHGHAAPAVGEPELTDSKGSEQPQSADADQAGGDTNSSRGSGDVLSAFMADSQLTADEQAAAAAASALKEMRGWVAEQDLRMVEPSIAARIPNKVVAARISMLQSETQVLQYQRKFYEAALAQLRGSPGSSDKVLHQRQLRDEDGASNSGDLTLDGNEGDSMQQQSGVDAAPCPSPTKQKLHHNHSFSGWAPQRFDSDSQQSCHVSTVVEGTTAACMQPCLLSACHSRMSEFSCSSDETPDLQVQQSGAGAADGSTAERRDKRTGRRLSLDIPLASEAAGSDDSSRQHGTDGYFGSSCLHTRTSLRRSVCSDSDVLQLSHSGLRPEQLDKVEAALAAAPWIRKLDLSGNMLTDGAIAELARMFSSCPEAAAVTHIDLSQNQLLTWRCCSALQQLLQAYRSKANDCQKQQANTLQSSTQSIPNSCSLYTSNTSNIQQALLSQTQASDGLSADGNIAQLADGAMCSAPQLKPLYLRFISLEGVGLGDKGAAALAAALQTDQQLQVLCLGRCGLHDAGGAAICNAVQKHPSMAELDISWNALSHQTSKAVAAAFRCPSCHLSSLSMSHCGLDDKDGSLIFNALLPAGSNSSINGTTRGDSSDDGLAARSWTFLDLSYNTLEGGAALCAAALVSAVNSSVTAGIDQQQWQQHQLHACSAAASGKAGSTTGSNGGGNNPRSGSRRLQSSSIYEDSNGLGSRVLLLDGNPLGASGLKSLMRALAGQPAVGVLLQESHTNSSSTLPLACAPSKSAANCGADGFSLQCERAGAGAATSSARTRSVESSNALQQHQTALPLHVGVAKVALMAKEKGFRSSMREAQSAAMLVSQVPTLLDAFVPASASAAKGQSSTANNSAASSKRKANQAAAMSEAADNGPGDSSKAGVLIVTETAAGFDLCCPAGQYRLSLSHPAVQHMLGQLLELRSRLQQLQQQVKLQQEQQAAIAAAARASSSGARAAARGNESSGVVPRGSRPPSPLPPASDTPSDGASALQGSSRRVTRTGSTTGTAASGVPIAASRPSTPQSSARSGVPVKRCFLNCMVDIPALTDLKLDGKLVKLEQLLELQPWRKSAAAPATSNGSNEAELAMAASTAARDMSDAVMKPKRPKIYKYLEFTVKAAAVLAGQEAPVMPARLLQWAVKVLSDPSSSDVWKLQLLELLVPDWLLLPEQVVQLLDLFDKELGQEEKLAAAGLMWARLVQPMDFWEQVLPTALKPLQQQRFKDMLGPQLMAFDRQNLTGVYTLNLSWSVHRAVAERLQLAALQDIATSECRYYLSWRNATLNGMGLTDKALAQLQAYAIPSSGSLKLDYVSYQVPDVSCVSGSQEKLQQLLRGLRLEQSKYYRHVLALRQEYLPCGQRKSEEEERQAASQARTTKSVRGTVSVPPSNPRAPDTQSTAPGNVDHDGDSAETGTQLPAQQVAWWQHSGIDLTATLSKYQKSNIPGLKTLLSSCCPSLPTGQARSRRSTRDLDAGVHVTGVLGAAKPQTMSRSRPASGVANSFGPPAGSTTRPGSAAKQATDSSAGSRRTTRSKQRPRSPLVFGSTSGASSNAAAAAAAETALNGAGGMPSDSRGVTDEELLVRLVAAITPAQAASAFSLMGTAHVASVLMLLAGMPRGGGGGGGGAAVAALLECLSPVVAARCLQDIGHQTALLPLELRARVEPLIKPAVLEILQQVGALLSQAATARWSQQLLLVRCFAAQVPGISCSQLGSILSLLGLQGLPQRCDVVVALWSKVTDRHRLVEVFEALSGPEQLGLMSALGSYHVWATLARPDGLHFRLDLTNPEQRDVAREVVKVAVRKSLAERAATGQRVRQLENFTAEGKPVADPEDDKLWLSMESKHRLLEFDFARTWEQELHRMEGAVKRIQRAWRKRAILQGYPISNGASYISTRPGTPGAAATAAVAAGGLTQRASAQSESSLMFSGQTSSCSCFNGTFGDMASTQLTGTTWSSFLSTPLSQSTHMSDAGGCQQQQNSAPHAVNGTDESGHLAAGDVSYNIGPSSSSYYTEASYCSPDQQVSSELPVKSSSISSMAAAQDGSRFGAAAAQSNIAEGIDLQTALAQQQAVAGWGPGGSSTRPTPRIG